MKITKEYCDYCGDEISIEGSPKNHIKMEISFSPLNVKETVPTLPLEEKDLCNECFGYLQDVVGTFKTAFTLIKQNIYTPPAPPET